VIGQWHTRWTDDSTRPALSVMWKFDLYEDPDVKSANDPPAITRVITIMLPSDY